MKEHLLKIIANENIEEFNSLERDDKIAIIDEILIKNQRSFILSINQTDANNAFLLTESAVINNLPTVSQELLLLNKDNNFRKNSMLHYAVISGFNESAKILFQHGFTISEETMINYAKYNNTPFIQLLIDNQIFYNDCKDTYNNNLLHVAVNNWHNEMIQTLIMAGVSTDTKNNNGVTPEDIVLATGDQTKIDFLNQCKFDYHEARMLEGPLIKNATDSSEPPQLMNGDYYEDEEKISYNIEI
ncbi:MAG: ankyrin repeat domain-containing protein [Gammaproteobacteria bacterium]|nr:MAG: ankyrin repeat domain-containing protein [Gammaproteobacteria bacterium]UTW41387.1 hypothetical protein KFE69_07640 [bacterium SCSIO 12844]